MHPGNGAQHQSSKKNLLVVSAGEARSANYASSSRTPTEQKELKCMFTCIPAITILPRIRSSPSSWRTCKKEKGKKSILFYYYVRAWTHTNTQDGHLATSGKKERRRGRYQGQFVKSSAISPGVKHPASGRVKSGSRRILRTRTKSEPTFQLLCEMWLVAAPRATILVS